MNSSKQYLEEGKLTFQKKISSLVVEQSFPKELIINLDQTTSSYYTLDIGARTVSVIGIDNKRQITAIFSISVFGRFC